MTVLPTSKDSLMPADGLLDGRVLSMPDELLDLLPVGIYVCDRLGRILRYNRAAAVLWGREPPLDDPGTMFCGSHRLYDSDMTPVRHEECPMAEVLATGHGVRDQQVTIERPDGSRIAAVIDIAPIKDEAGRVTGAVNLFREDPARGRLRPRPAGASTPLDDVLQALPTAIYTTDAAGRITFFNEAAAELWGTRPQIGSDAFCGSWRLEWPDGTPLARDECPMAQTLREQRPVHGLKAVAVRRDGRRVPFLAVPTPLFDAEGQLTGAVNMLVDLSQQVAAEDRISRTEARYRDIFDGVEVALWEEDFSAVADLLDEIRAEGVHDLRDYLARRPDRLRDAVARVRVTDVNAYACTLFEATSREELLRSLDAVFLPETNFAFVDELVAMWERRPDHAGETAMRTLRGRRLDVAFTIVFSGDRGDRALVSLLDLSGRRAAERAQLKLTRRLETLNRVSRAIASDLDLQRIVQTVTDAATEVTGARFGAFFYNEVDADGERYTLYALSGAARSDFERFGLPRNTAVFEPTFRGTDIIRSDDIRSDPRYGRSPPHHGMPPGHLPVVSYLAVPVVSRSGEVHGGLFFGHDRAGVFTAESEALVAGIAAHAATAMDNARLLQAAKAEVEIRRRSEQAAQQLAAIVASSDDAILSKDLDGIIASWNAGAERIFGYVADEMIGKPITILIPDDRQDEEAAILAQIRRGERVHHFETVRRRKDGTLIDISLTVSPVKNGEGVIVGASKIARDITERKRAEHRQQLLLREMDHRVKNLFALSSSVVSLSARSAPSVKELARAVQRRLHALAHAHTLTLPQSLEDAGQPQQRTTLRALIETIVAPFDVRDDGAQARIDYGGCDIPIAGAGVSGFALLLHELATNAAKHGALSSPTGHVNIQCLEEGELFVLVWTERGGPAVPTEILGEGFGSLLSRAIVEGQLRGQIDRDWSEAGLTIRIAVPRERAAAED